MTILYDYWRSSASYRVRIALALAGMDWTPSVVNLLEAEHTGTAHLARNPQGFVPALDVDGALLTQSLAIVEYLDETRGLGLLPDNALDRARTRALAHAIAVDIHPVCNLSVARHAVEASNGLITMEGWMQHFIGPRLAAVEAMIEGPDFCIGGALSLADLCLVPQVYNARRWNIDLSRMPRIVAIAHHLETLPAFVAAKPENVPH